MTERVYIVPRTGRLTTRERTILENTTVRWPEQTRHLVYASTTASSRGSLERRKQAPNCLQRVRDRPTGSTHMTPRVPGRILVKHATTLGCGASMCHVPRWERPGGASPDAQSCPKRRLGQQQLLLLLYCFLRRDSRRWRRPLQRVSSHPVGLPSSGKVRLQRAGWEMRAHTESRMRHVLPVYIVPRTGRLTTHERTTLAMCTL